MDVTALRAQIRNHPVLFPELNVLHFNESINDRGHIVAFGVSRKVRFTVSADSAVRRITRSRGIPESLDETGCTVAGAAMRAAPDRYLVLCRIAQA